MAPLRVLHVVGRMHRGGVETWLMHVLRSVDRSRVRMDFLVTRPEPAEYDDEIRRLGSEVIPCVLEPTFAPFAKSFLSILRERGPYQVVHSHVHHFSGAVLAIAWLAGVPVRIAHSHLDTLDLDRDASFVRALYLRAMTAALSRFATGGVAVSGDAAAALYGRRWREDPRWRVIRCALDLASFREPVDVGAVRAELGLAPDALVFAHVGRFDPQKNHAFLVEIAAAAVRREPRARFVLVGAGPLRRATEEEAGRRGVRDAVVFAGVRGDVARLLRSSDAFILPSLREGLPLVGIEAQAAGLPILCSDRVTRELVVVPELFTFLSPTDSADAWAQAALEAAKRRRSPAGALAAMEESEFSMAPSLRRLLSLYEARPA